MVSGFSKVQQRVFILLKGEWGGGEGRERHLGIKVFSSRTQKNEPVKAWTQTFRSRVQRTNQSAMFKWVSKVMKDCFDWSRNFAPSPLPISGAAHLKTNHNFAVRVFPRFRQFPWFYLWLPYQLLFPIFLPKNLRMPRQLHLPRSFNCFWLFKHTVLTQAHVVAPSPWHYCKIIQSSQSLW